MPTRPRLCKGQQKHQPPQVAIRARSCCDVGGPAEAMAVGSCESVDVGSMSVDIEGTSADTGPHLAQVEPYFGHLDNEAADIVPWARARDPCDDPIRPTMHKQWRQTTDRDAIRGPARPQQRTRRGKLYASTVGARTAGGLPAARASRSMPRKGKRS